jgi:hypothetical protein
VTDVDQLDAYLALRRRLQLVEAARLRRADRRRRYTWLGLVLAFLGFSLSLWAQAPVTVGPVTTAMSLAWETRGATSPAHAASFELLCRIDGAAIPLSPTVVTCTAVAAGEYSCAAKLTAVMVTALNVAGVHTINLKLLDPATKLETPDAVPFVLAGPPGVPTGLRIIP